MVAVAEQATIDKLWMPLSFAPHSHGYDHDTSNADRRNAPFAGASLAGARRPGAVWPVWLAWAAAAVDSKA